MSGSNELSRRDFIKVTTGIVGGLIGVAIGLPTISYLIDPALKEGGKDVWVSIGKFEDMQVGVPYPFSFTRVQVNGWERTSNSFGGYALRKSDDPKDLVILNSRCTHLGCVPIGHQGNFEGWACPCHGSQFDAVGRVRRGPAPINLPIPPYAFQTDTKIRIGEQGGKGEA